MQCPRCKKRERHVYPSGKVEAYCQPCRKEKERLRYKNLSKEKKEAKLKRDRVYKKKIRKFLFIYAANRGCSSCGTTDPRVLDFDHRDPKEKVAGISEMVRNRYSFESIVEELNKCDVLCANCHRIRSAEQFNWYNWEE